MALGSLVLLISPRASPKISSTVCSTSNIPACSASGSLSLCSPVTPSLSWIRASEVCYAFPLLSSGFLIGFSFPVLVYDLRSSPSCFLIYGLVVVD